jgi:hypothetical protein
MPTDESRELDVRLEHYLRRARARCGHIPRQSHPSTPDMDHPQPLPWIGDAVKHIDQPLHIVELQPQRIIKIDIGLIGSAHPEREGPLVRQIRYQQCAIGAGPQYQICRPHNCSSAPGAA